MAIYSGNSYDDLIRMIDNEIIKARRDMEDINIPMQEKYNISVARSENEIIKDMLEGGYKSHEICELLKRMK